MIKQLKIILVVALSLFIVACAPQAEPEINSVVGYKLTIGEAAVDEGPQIQMPVLEEDCTTKYQEVSMGEVAYKGFTMEVLNVEIPSADVLINGKARTLERDVPVYAGDVEITPTLLLRQAEWAEDAVEFVVCY